MKVTKDEVMVPAEKAGRGNLAYMPHIDALDHFAVLVTASEPIASALHYPECWDTTAYPTVWDALAEVSASFTCSNNECCHQRKE